MAVSMPLFPASTPGHDRAAVPGSLKPGLTFENKTPNIFPLSDYARHPMVLIFKAISYIVTLSNYSDLEGNARMIYREIFRQFVLMERPVAVNLNKIISGFDLTLSQWKVIDFIERSGTCTLVAISRHFSIEKPHITRTINSLEEKQLVEKLSGKDKREKRIQLTVLGKEMYAACRNILDKVELHLVSGMSDEEQRALLRSLIAIRDNMKNYSGPDE